MRVFIIFAVLLMTVTNRLVAQTDAFKPMSLTEAMAQGKKEQKFVFIDFYATWCMPCKELERDLFSRQDVSAFLNQNFISIRFDIDKNKEIASQYKIESVPTLLFLDSEGREVKRIIGKMEVDRFIRAAKVVMGQEMSFESLYKEYQKDPKDLTIAQKTLLEFPYYVKEIQPQSREKWIARAMETFQTYVANKGLENMINAVDFKIITQCYKPSLGEQILVFVNDRYADFKSQFGDEVDYFLVGQQNALIYDLAKSGDLRYKTELEKVQGTMRQTYSTAKYPNMTPYEFLTYINDAVYTLCAQKDENKYVEIRDQLFKKLGDQVTLTDYLSTIQELLTVRGDKVKKSSYEYCLKWLDCALGLKNEVKDQLSVLILMGDCFKELDMADKARAAYNQAYVYAMQMKDADLQEYITLLLQQL